MDSGKLTVITGPMYSGKSSELLHKGERHILAKQKVVYIKPAIDTRYSKSAIVTHIGKSVDALVIEKDMYITDMKEIIDADVVLIDELQFFGPSIIVDILLLIGKGKIIYAAALDLDFKAEPFSVTSYALAISDEVMKLKAVCEVCGRDAMLSFRKSKSKELIELGEKDSYIPVCRTCFGIKTVMGGIK